jgi:hypothetical protein
MAGKGPSPLLGYNTNVRRRGVLCHVQTEDSGISHPHVITHVFTAGTIIGTRKRSYKEHVGADQLEPLVRKLMQEQHKAMCIALRDGELDANLPTRDTAKMEAFTDEASPPLEAPSPPPPETEPVLELDLGEDVLEAARAGTPTPPSPRPAVHFAADAVPTPIVPAKEPALPPIPAVAVAAASDVAKPKGTPLTSPQRASLVGGPGTPPQRASLVGGPGTPPQRASLVGGPGVAPPPTRPPPERPPWLAEPRETPPPPSMVQSKPQQLPADTTYGAKPQETVPVPSPRTSPPVTRKRASTLPPPPRPVAVGRRAPAEPPAGEDGAGRYSSKASTLFSTRRGPTPPPPPPPVKEPRRPPSTPRSSIFGQEYISEKSLDEVILAYLSEEMDEK